jgi:hypothetical protein
MDYGQPVIERLRQAIKQADALQHAPVRLRRTQLCSEQRFPAEHHSTSTAIATASPPPRHNDASPD